jgi:hypothetical protein
VIQSARDSLDAAWRAAAYCLHPRAVVLSLLPLLLVGGLAFGLGWFYWEAATDAVRDTLASWELLSAFFKVLQSVGLGGLKSMVGPLVVVFLATPVLVVLSLLAVSVIMTPAMVSLVAQRRFPALERRRGGTFVGGVLHSVWLTVLAVVVFLVTLPLWLMPPLALLMPPLIWGWLTYRVMSYDVLADHASVEERRLVLRKHRPTYMLMGLITGYLGVVPSLVWALAGGSVVMAPVVVPVVVWVYMLVFAFAALWFAHHALAALAQLRREREGQTAPPPVVAPAELPSAVTAPVLGAPPAP